MTPFNELYERSPIGWFKTGDIEGSSKKVRGLQTKILVAQNRQNEYIYHKAGDHIRSVNRFY